MSARTASEKYNVIVPIFMSTSKETRVGEILSLINKSICRALLVEIGCIALPAKSNTDLNVAEKKVEALLFARFLLNFKAVASSIDRAIVKFCNVVNILNAEVSLYETLKDVADD